ncbi:hypothetical protein AB9K26_12320 [Psychroserpens sp. XS_ASV72]|uniref:hypothetical protein n=1 Tax=Psychroserpens sp. XS_ASV72 TaxID=3241293 RepID=UPI003510FCB9
MKTIPTSELSCSVFGHNLERVSKYSSELVCKTCHSKVSVDQTGKFDTLPVKNQELKTALRQLFLLQNRLSNREFSI